MAEKRRKGKAGKWEYFESGRGGAVYWNKAKGQYELRNKTGKMAVRKFFSELAVANREAKRLNGLVSGYGSTFTSFSQSERRAVEAYREFRAKMEACGVVVRDLPDILADAFAREKVVRESPMFTDVMDQYWAAMSRKGVSDRHLMVVRGRLDRIRESFDGVMIGDVGTDRVLKFLDFLPGKGGRPAAAETVNQHRGLFSAIFRFAMRRGIVEKNPVAVIEKVKLSRGRPEVITPAELRVVMSFVARHAVEYVPLMVLKVFCGLRTAECARLRFRHIGMGGRDEVTIDGTIAKNKDTRFVPIPECGRLWLAFASKQGVGADGGGFVVSGPKESSRNDNVVRLMRRVTAETGVVLPQNVFRHSAASYLCAVHENFPAVASWLGHDLAVLKANYRNAVTKSEGEEWFKVVPGEGEEVNQK